MNPVTSYVTSFVALAVMLSTLAYAPFSHVHSEEAHHGEGTHGFQVHSHLPLADRGERETDEPVVDASSHDGRHVDLFLSLVAKPFPVAASVEVHTDVKPQSETTKRQGVGRPDRARDPPARNVSSRAPPV